MKAKSEKSNDDHHRTLNSVFSVLCFDIGVNNKHLLTSATSLTPSDANSPVSHILYFLLWATITGGLQWASEGKSKGWLVSSHKLWNSQAYVALYSLLSNSLIPLLRRTWEWPMGVLGWKYGNVIVAGRYVRTTVLLVVFGQGLVLLDSCLHNPLYQSWLRETFTWIRDYVTDA